MNLIVHKNINDLVKEHYKGICKKLKYPVGKRLYSTKSVYNKLDEKYNFYKGTDTFELFEYLRDNHYKILTGNFKELEDQKKEINRILKNNSIKLKKRDPSDGKMKTTQVHKDIMYCFDYDTYSKSGKPYQLLLALGINVCPYCNRQFVNTYISKDGKTRATLDHFYSKGEHPYFSLSFYNLIPSCYSCNTSLKGKKQFSYNHNVNPYHSSFEGIVNFTIGFNKVNNTHKYISEFYADEKFMKIKFKSLIHKNRNDYKKVKKNIETFKLEELYNLHKDIVIKLLQQQVIYNQSGYAITLQKQYPKIFNSEYDVLKALISYEKQHENFNNVPFSKLIRDISIELKLDTKLI